MKVKLFKTALITAPIIAIYGVSPIFLFNKIDILQIVLAFLFLTTLIISFWFINIILTNNQIKQTTRYFLSYTITFLLHFCIIFLIPKFPDQPNPSDFLLYSLLSSLAINTIILVIINSELLKHKKNLAEYEVQKLLVGNLEAQKQVLLQQLQPHFLFNALSTLKSLIRENPRSAEDYSLKLSEFLRYSVQSHTNEVVTLGQELQFVVDYLQLQKVRFGEALNCKIDVSDTLLQFKVPVLAVQTLVENAIKHNSFTEKKPLQILVTSNGSRLTVTNNKSPKQIVYTSGTGLQNLNNRYKLIADSGIEILDEPTQYTVHLKLI